MNPMIPQFVQPFLWSYDIQALDVSRDKRRIITNVLNLGTSQATDWLFEVYTKEDIRDCLTHPLPGEWNNKSMIFWSLLMDVEPALSVVRVFTIGIFYSKKLYEQKSIISIALVAIVAASSIAWWQMRPRPAPKYTGPVEKIVIANQRENCSSIGDCE